MKYFVVSDVHSFYSILKRTLDKSGFDLDNTEHMLVICGDLFDRGDESIQCFNLANKLAKLGRLIYIRGNHEDLLEECVRQLKMGTNIPYHHISNGTLKTIGELCGCSAYDLLNCSSLDQIDNTELLEEVLQFIKDNALDYHELDNYVFVHGWIPGNTDYKNGSFHRARWVNGFDAWKQGVRIPNKTIVCGHWHTSFAHSSIHNDGSEWGNDANFGIFEDEGIIGIDACTAYSSKINCLVIDK